MATIEQRVTVIEKMLETLPGDLNVRFDHAKAERDEMKAQISRLQTDVSGLKTDMTRLKQDVAEIKAELKALPRVLAEMLKS